MRGEKGEEREGGGERRGEKGELSGSIYKNEEYHLEEKGLQ